MYKNTGTLQLFSRYSQCSVLRISVA